MKIGELSKKTGLSIHTIHYYEKIGLIRNNSKDKSGHREYTENDIERVRFITCLKATEMTLDQIRHFISLIEKGDSTVGERSLILHEQRKQLEQKISSLNKHLWLIDYKIEYYSQKITS